MSYDRINPDGSITRVPGTYNVKKNRAIIQGTIDNNLRLRAEKKRKQADELSDRADRIATYLRLVNDGKRVDIRDFVPHD
jgi:hypothetical protein